MEMLLSLILGPLGKILGIIVTVGGAIFYGKYYKAKAEKAQARADGYQAQAEITQKTLEVEREDQKVKEQVHHMSDDDLADFLRHGGVRKDH